MNHNLICDYLRELGVPFTEGYTSKRFTDMPFKTMFGLTKLLEEYGVESEGYFLKDKTEIHKITTPFLARTLDGYTIVTHITPKSISYLTQGEAETVNIDDFMKAWDGNVILSFPSDNAIEPQYEKHASIELLNKSKKWVLLLCTALVFLYFFITNSIYSSISSIFVTAFDIAGLFFTYLLVQKSSHIQNKTADKVCGVLQSGGCDSILEMKASKFFGLFGWSEVGFSYFSVSLGTLLLFPNMMPWLALANVCCLPFTIWSIWYQKFRAHKWCTLCVCVQLSLWLLFFSYLSGGYIRHAWPIDIKFFVLGIVYLVVMLGINAIMQLIDKTDK